MNFICCAQLRQNPRLHSRQLAQEARRTASGSSRGESRWNFEDPRHISPARTETWAIRERLERSIPAFVPNFSPCVEDEGFTGAENASRSASSGGCGDGMRRLQSQKPRRRGPEPWEAKSSLRTRTSYDRSVYIRGYSDSKEVSFYPYHEPAYGPASLSSISYLSRYPAFSTLGSFR